MPCALEQADVADRRRDQRRGDRTDAGDRGQAARSLIVPRVSDDLRFECLDAFSQRVAGVLAENPPPMPPPPAPAAEPRPDSGQWGMVAFLVSEGRSSAP